MSERGSIVKRKLDFWLGVPLAAAAGACRRMARPAPGPLDPAAVHSVGVLCLGAIGDLLLASGLVAALAAKLLQANVTVIASRANAPALDLMPPACGRAVFGVTDLPGLVRHLRQSRYDLLFDTSQWPRLGAVASACSGAGLTVGFATSGQHRHFAYDLAVPHSNERHEAENFMELGRAVLPGLAGEPRLYLPERPVTALALPGAPLVFCHLWPSGLRAHLKEWPAEQWAALAARLLGAGYGLVFTGGPGDAAPTRAFMERYLPEDALRAGRAISLAGAVSLIDLACLLRDAAAVVSVNTGVMHLAALTGAPTVALNGPTNPLRWGPVGPRTRSLLPGKGRYAYLNLGFEYPQDADTVLRHLPVSAVITALKELGLSL